VLSGGLLIFEGVIALFDVGVSLAIIDTNGYP
jgi:hypothetical protein